MDSVLNLITESAPTYDAYGNETVTETSTQVYCKVNSVYNSEFYNAQQTGLNPSVTFWISNRADYAGQKIVEHEGKRYRVIRTDWRDDRDSISLICEEQINEDK